MPSLCHGILPYQVSCCTAYIVAVDVTRYAAGGAAVQSEPVDFERVELRVGVSSLGAFRAMFVAINVEVPVSATANSERDLVNKIVVRERRRMGAAGGNE